MASCPQHSYLFRQTSSTEETSTKRSERVDSASTRESSTTHTDKDGKVLVKSEKHGLSGPVTSTGKHPGIKTSIFLLFCLKWLEGEALGCWLTVGVMGRSGIVRPDSKAEVHASGIRWILAHRHETRLSTECNWMTFVQSERNDEQKKLFNNKPLLHQWVLLIWLTFTRYPTKPFLYAIKRGSLTKPRLRVCFGLIRREAVRAIAFFAV